MLKKITIIIPVLLITILSGCGIFGYHDVKDEDLVEVSYDSVDELREKLTRTIPQNSLILVSTLLNVDDLYKTSSFGRIVSNQIASAFHNSGYRIIGMEMPIDLFAMEKGGTLKLSDETKEMLKPYNATVIVGGVYAPGKKNAYVSLRIIDLYTKNIISSIDFSVPMGPDARKLLVSKKVGSAGARPTTVVEETVETEGEEVTIEEKETPKPEEAPAESFPPQME